MRTNYLLRLAARQTAYLELIQEANRRRNQAVVELHEYDTSRNPYAINQILYSRSHFTEKIMRQMSIIDYLKGRLMTAATIYNKELVANV